jgi:hypothetical protein
MRMARKSLKQWLLAANGWQRLWFVCSIICLLYFVIIFPLVEVDKGRSFRYESLWSTEKEMRNPNCATYMTSTFDKLAEPQYSKDGSTCYNIYIHRKYAENNAPITEAIYQQQFVSNERQLWLIYIGIGFAVSSFLATFVYGVGVVVRWIMNGFRKGESV